MTPKLRMVMEVLERAKDCQDEMVIAACRRLIKADRLGWRKHADPQDVNLVRSFAE